MVNSDGGKRAAANFAQNIKARREAIGMSQEHLAEAMTARGFGFTQATVWKVESSQRGISLTEALAIAEILGDGGAPLSVESLMRAPEADRARQVLESATANLAAASVRIEDAVASYVDATESYASAYAIATDRTAGDDRTGAIWRWADPAAPELIALAARLGLEHGDDAAIDAVEDFRRSVATHGWAWSPPQSDDVTKEMTDDG